MERVPESLPQMFGFWDFESAFFFGFVDVRDFVDFSFVFLFEEPVLKVNTYFQKKLIIQ